MRIISLCTLFFTSLTALSQTGGGHTFALLDLAYNARSAALGNDFLTAKDQDLNLAVGNPSLYNTRMNRGFGFNQALLAGGINYGMLTYARDIKNVGTGGASIRYVNYGRMDRRDETGALIGSFSPAEFIFGAGLGRQLNPQISVGANLNLIYSQLESYNSLGAAIDLAGSYELEKANLFVTAVVKNAGFQFKSYTKKNRAPLPAEFQLAVAHKLMHAPFRFTVLMHHLNTWDLTYNDPNLRPTIDPLTGDTVPVKSAGTAEKIFRHLTFQTEILFSKNFHFRAAFDYHRRQEMRVEQRTALSGFSFGAGAYFKRFSVDYALVVYSAAGYNNMLTLTTSFDKWKR